MKHNNKFEIHLKTRRNFIEILNSLGNNPDLLDIKKAMQVGDCINMPYQDFSSWMQPTPTDPKDIFFKDKPKMVIVSIAKILDDGNKILIQTGNQQKEIDSSIFFDYAKNLNH